MNPSDEHKAVWLSRIESALRALKGEASGGPVSFGGSGHPSDEAAGRRQTSSSAAGDRR